MGIDLDRTELEAALIRINDARSHELADRELESELEAGLVLEAAHALAVYGTLAPGRENHHVLSGLGGEWSEVTIEGELGDWMGYPMFRWIPGAPRIRAWLLRSTMLPAHYGRLDDFETAAYARHVVACDGTSGTQVANCYVEAPPRA